MKKTFLVTLIAPALLCLSVVGCSTTRPEPARHAFSFEHQGQTFDILSTDARMGEGGNVLVRREAGRFVFRAVDYDQDGLLDELMLGDLTLEEANEIYLVGIETARRRGKFGVRTPLRVYESQDGRYSIQSNVNGPSAWCNRFTRHALVEQHAFVALDVDGDGRLDRIQEGTVALESAQTHYESVLDEGVRSGRIERRAIGFIVLPRTTVASQVL